MKTVILHVLILVLSFGVILNAQSSDEFVKPGIDHFEEISNVSEVISPGYHQSDINMNFRGKFMPIDVAGLHTQNNIAAVSTFSQKSKKDFAYYQDEYRDASINFWVGAGLIFTGSGFALAGVLIVDNNDFYSANAGSMIGLVLVMLSIPSISIGSWMMIQGGIRRCKTRKVMKEYERKVSLSFEMKGDGIGMVMRF